MKQIFVYLIRGYQRLISHVGNQMSIPPSCSAYAIESIEKNGVVSGGFQTLRRLSKCHPFHDGGFDPVEKM
ncbi:MAG: membrane protein insertion efficiency factor YidD [Bdellovibrionota bacterium]